MKIGFIGSGNMAKALMKGILDKGISSNEEIISSDIELTSTKSSSSV